MAHIPTPPEEEGGGGERFAAVKHLSDSEIAEEQLVGLVARPTDRLVVPARNEERCIAATIGYALGNCRFDQEQICVVINGTTDNTEAAARAVAPGVTIIRQDDVIGEAMKDRLQKEFGIDPKRVHGKGTAFFAAALWLQAQQSSLTDDARIFMLDADIRNVGHVDPVGRLFAGWETFGDEGVRLMKLASLNRDNAGIWTFLAHAGAYAPIGALQWPLCGQMSLRWGDFCRMRLMTGYCVEMAMAVSLLEECGTAAVFGEVEIGTPLIDRPNNDRSTTLMYIQITAFLRRLLARAPRHLTKMTGDDIRVFNADRPTHRAWVPADPGKGGNRYEAIPLDAIYPSVAEFLPK